MSHKLGIIMGAFLPAELEEEDGCVPVDHTEVANTAWSAWGGAHLSPCTPHARWHHWHWGLLLNESLCGRPHCLDQWIMEAKGLVPAVLTAWPARPCAFWKEKQTTEAVGIWEESRSHLNLWSTSQRYDSIVEAGLDHSHSLLPWMKLLPKPLISDLHPTPYPGVPGCREDPQPCRSSWHCLSP